MSPLFYYHLSILDSFLPPSPSVSAAGYPTAVTRTQYGLLTSLSAPISFWSVDPSGLSSYELIYRYTHLYEQCQYTPGLDSTFNEDLVVFLNDISIMEDFHPFLTQQHEQSLPMAVESRTSTRAPSRAQSVRSSRSENPNMAVDSRTHSRATSAQSLRPLV